MKHAHVTRENPERLRERQRAAEMRAELRRRADSLKPTSIPKRFGKVGNRWR